jgi:hypothetical protein
MTDSVARSADSRFWTSVGKPGIDERISQPQRDEGLTRDADASGVSIDRPQRLFWI